MVIQVIKIFLLMDPISKRLKQAFIKQGYYQKFSTSNHPILDIIVATLN
jgi:hypothetical protein